VKRPPTLTCSDEHNRRRSAALNGALDSAVLAGLGDGPGQRYAAAVLLVAVDGRVVHHRAYGHAQTHDGADLLPVERPATVETIFDLASISKVVGTTAALMALNDDGQLDLDTQAGHLLPQLSRSAVRTATVRQLLTHRAGVWEWQPAYLHAHTATDVLDYISGLPLRSPVGSCRRYSDIGFMLLGAVVEVISGQPLHQYVRARVHAPLGMASTLYTPPATMRGNVAATSRGDAYERDMVATGRPYPLLDGNDGTPFGGWRGHTLVGEVNDGNAWHGCGGVAGHAGLFSTARDVATFAQAVLNGGGYGDMQMFSLDTVESFLAPHTDEAQALGFWSNRLSAVGARGGFGHSGFTGVEFLLDPERRLVVVLLTNRLHLPGVPRDISAVWAQILRHVLRATRDGSFRS
jgi:CubicO group peptidase (beta-lactamase class C family)